jgi:predicted alpha/beta hydrolase
VVAYDYRGIGESRPAVLRDFDAGRLDWGAMDLEAVLHHTTYSFTDQPIHVVAHSLGGFIHGLAPSNHLVQRIFTIGTQYAYRGAYADRKKLH